MLGYIKAGERGLTDRLLAEVAAVLQREGVALAGVVQVNDEYDPARPCHMDLHILDGGEVIRISQNLGALSKGCRLDPAGLEQAVGLVGRALGASPRLLIINKFGKQEVDGRGFRPLIGQALAEGIPVLTAAGGENAAGFDRFAEGLAEPLEPDTDTVLHWCRAKLKEVL
jgi:hypothetical protein